MHDVVALALQGREVLALRERLALLLLLLLLPGLDEELLELGDDGAFDLQVGVAPRLLLARAARAGAARRSAGSTRC